MSTPQDLQLAFDVGHSSIGWAVLQTPEKAEPSLLGCGAVIFPADDCLASQRRQFRRQRRHIRATRQRIARIKRLLAHLGVLSGAQLDENVCAWPWLLAARVLRNGPLLQWQELWSVLRWYAHNRGYDGNKAWSRHEADAAAAKEDTEKVERARGLLANFVTKHERKGSMAEVWCDISGLDPLGTKTSCALPGKDRPKGQNAAFPREDIEHEVRAILIAHRGRLNGLDDALVTALMEKWDAVPCRTIKLPNRFRGGLLFGQLVPRFENRIIASCPLHYERVYQRVLTETNDTERAKREAEKQSKVPSAGCAEYFRYRWAMQVANVLVQTPDSNQPRRLSAVERKELNAQIGRRGYFTKSEFRKTIRALTGAVKDNLDQMLLHPDADKALVVDPVQRILIGADIAPYFAALPERLQKRARGWLRNGRPLRLERVHNWLTEFGNTNAFNEVIARKLDEANTKLGKKNVPVTREMLLNQEFTVAAISGRAPHSREIMNEVVAFVLNTDRHPAEVGGPLYRSEAVRAAQLQRAIDEQTNNHLVRHRLRLLERLHTDVINAYADGQKERVKKVTIEVNRDLRELSGKTTKEIAQDIGLRLSNFKGVAAKLEEQLMGRNIAITPGLIRKARIAEDLGWTCPYTGQTFDVFDLINRRVDKDHIVPRSERASDSLDSLVITFVEVNKMKGKRTAARFIEDCGGRSVDGLPQLSLKTPQRYDTDVKGLETYKGHGDDKRRKDNRKRLLLLRDYVEKEFTPRDLTQTSQLVRLGAQALQVQYADAEREPVITSLPGSVTGTVRKSWDLLGCLESANQQIIDPDTKRPRTKTEIRDITHLHHALDACVLAFAALLLPRDGGIWELLVKRRLNADEQERARNALKTYVEFDKEGTLHLIDLPKGFKDQIRARLSERRVVQHIPAETRGLRAELNAWRVVRVDDGEATLRQRMRQPDGTRPLKEKSEKTAKLIGLRPGKLQRLKAALIVADNFGLALDPEPQIIPFHQVWVRLRELREKNNGKAVRVLRGGALIRVPRGKFVGVWRIFSVKNNASGLALDIGRPDVVRLQNKREGHKINVLLASLLRDGLEPTRYTLTGLRA